MEAIGGDGFLISTPFQRTNRRFIIEVTEGLVPALQERGLMRTAYSERHAARGVAGILRLRAQRAAHVIPAHAGMYTGPNRRQLTRT